MAKLQRETDVANVLSQMSQLVQYPHESGKLSDNNISNEPDEHAYAQNSSRSDKPASCLNSKSSSKGNNVQSAVSGKKHVCELCGRAFGKLCNLKSHLRVHSGDRPHTCDVCSHAFGSLWDLIKHSRIHSGEKPYKCCYCGRCFAAFGSHQRHLRLHTNEKPYQCHVCSKDFSRLDSYKNHLNTHSDDKPFICQKCDKKFAYQSSYKRHMNTHDLGEKRFTCNACNKSFTRHDYLIVHTRKHDEQENHDEDKKRVDDASLDSVIDINEGELLLCPSTEIQSSSSYSVNADLSPIPILLSMAECTVVNGSMCNTMEYLDSASLLAAASEIELGTSGEMSTSHYDVGIDLETCPITAASQSENNAISEKSAFESQSDQQKKPHDESAAILSYDEYISRQNVVERLGVSPSYYSVALTNFNTSIESPEVIKGHCKNWGNALELRDFYEHGNMDIFACRDIILWKDVRISASIFGLLLFLLTALSFYSVLTVLTCLTIPFITLQLMLRAVWVLKCAFLKEPLANPFQAWVDKDIDIDDNKISRCNNQVLQVANTAMKSLKHIVFVVDLLDTAKALAVLFFLYYLSNNFSGITLLFASTVIIFTIPKIFKLYQADIHRLASIVAENTTTFVIGSKLHYRSVTKRKPRVHSLKNIANFARI
eukprot:gene7906-8760_t